MDETRTIGYQNRIPWYVPDDIKRFARLTKGHAVLMGRKTWDSLEPKYRPLPKRKNIVVSRSTHALEGAEVWNSLSECLAAARSGALTIPSGQLWVIGGEQVYRAALPTIDIIELTRVAGRHQGDAYFPEFEHDFQLTARESHDGYDYERWERKR